MVASARIGALARCFFSSVKNGFFDFGFSQRLRDYCCLALSVVSFCGVCSGVPEFWSDAWNKFFSQKKGACSVDDSSYYVYDVVFSKIDGAEPHARGKYEDW